MKTKLSKLALSFLILSLPFTSIQAQEKSYREVAKERADKIVAGLDLFVKDKLARTSVNIADQYVALNEIQEARDKKVKSVENKADAKKQIETIKKESDVEIAKLHQSFLAKLSKDMDREQVDKVKDGMTYNVVPLTFANYLLMLPYLTQQQQNKIMDFLVEAREYAMDGGSSKEKHAWFGKYKGKITNYLTAEGFDLKKEGADWAKRRNMKSSDLEIVESNRIISVLKFEDASHKESARNLIAHQYQQIQLLQKERDAKMKESSAGIKDKEQANKAESEVWVRYKKKLDDQRDLFIRTLVMFVGSDQVEVVKNEMTGNDLHKEYAKFQALLPNMTEVQKKKVYDYLLQARKNAMNVLTSRDREQWFAKYRGRANNYLASQNYDLRKATEELEKREAKAVK